MDTRDNEKMAIDSRTSALAQLVTRTSTVSPRGRESEIMVTETESPNGEDHLQGGAAPPAPLDLASFAAGSVASRAPNLDHAEVTGTVAGLRHRASSGGDTALTALADAAEEFTKHWDERCRAAQSSRAAYEHAVEAEARSRSDLASLLVVVDSVLEARGESECTSSESRHDLTADSQRQPARAPRPHAALHHRFAALMLGPFRLFASGCQIETCGSTKTYRVVRYLLARRRRAVPRDLLIETFWPGADLDTGRRNLHQSVYLIRKALRGVNDEQPVIIFERDAYSLTPTCGATSMTSSKRSIPVSVP